MKSKYLIKFVSSLIYLVTTCHLNCIAQFTYNLTFNESDYNYTVSDNGFTTINSKNPIDRYADGKVPCLPFSSKKILLPFSSDIESFDIEYGLTKIIKQNILLAEAKHPTTGTEQFLSSNITTNYTPISFPDCNLVSMRSYEWQGMTIATFDVTPFIYDAEDQSLSFINDIAVTIKVKQHSPISKMTENPEEVIAVLKSWVNNPQDVDDIVSQSTSTSSTDFLEKIEYILITTEELREPFQKLVNWKRARGVHAELVTLDRIESWYEGADIQEKIKHCILDLHNSYGCKYAVLGGDSIPTRKCYIEAYDERAEKYYTYDDAPVDKYYGCFGGNFEWNANGNNLYGEVDDDIDFTESVYVSRIPVRTNEEADAFIQKLIAYEKGITSDYFSESILTAGANLRGEVPFGGRSDADKWGDMFYDSYLKGWSGKRVRFYDTGNDIYSNKKYDFTASNLQEQLANNHMFVSVNTHGIENKWLIKLIGAGYKVHDALSLITTGTTIITTAACLTNAFDAVGENEPCLSEAFIRGASNGVVAYLGCSREGWMSSSDNELGASLKYEGEFYKNLFNNNIEWKNYGKIVSYASAAIQEQCSEYSPYRFVKMCLNPMGDAEMPIFTHKSNKFNNVSLSFTEHCIEIDAGVENCKICVMSLDDYGKSYYKTLPGVRSVSVDNLPTLYCVSITKPGYEPYIFACRDLTSVVEYGRVDIYGTDVEFTPTRYYIVNLDFPNQSTTLSYFHNIKYFCNGGTNSIQIEINGLEYVHKKTILSLHNVYGKLERSFQISDKMSQIIEIENIKSGTYIISLSSDGEIFETKKINI